MVGNDFMVIWDEQLIPQHKQEFPPKYQAPEPYTVEEVTIGHIKGFFTSYMVSENLEQTLMQHMLTRKTQVLYTGTVCD